MKRRILFIDHDPGLSGSTISMGYIIAKFKREGFEVQVITPKKGTESAFITNLGAGLIPFRSAFMNDFTLDVHSALVWPFNLKSFITIVKNAAKFFAGLKFLCREIKKVNPDLVYLNEYCIIQGAIASRRLGIPAVLHIRSLYLKGFIGIRRSLLRKAIIDCCDLVFPISEIEKDQLRLGKENSAKVKVIGEFLDEKNFAEYENRNLLKKTFMLPENKLIVTMLGGVYSIKGTRDFIEAARIFLKKGGDAVFIVAGSIYKDNPASNGYYLECMKLLDSSEFKERIRIIDHVENAVELLAVSDIVISLNTITHFSRPVIEAWAQKKPVISYDTRHARSLIDENENGLLVKQGDVQGVADAICRLQCNQELSEKMGRNGFKKAALYFDAHKNLQEIFDYSKALIKG